MAETMTRYAVECCGAAPWADLEINADAFRIESKIEEAWTLPSVLYTDPKIFAAEKEKIFSRTWQVVEHLSQVAKPGDYFTTELAGEPLLCVCGSDGKPRGFYNVCRHRAGPPAAGCGSRKVFRRGYHGWTYDHDGTLISATESTPFTACTPLRCDHTTCQTASSTVPSPT
jgi:phenylpropionate dioxygenase-like ring-hydroxylating dioxygenase large terminal subunit